jgi:hypothetical protein
VRHQIDELTMLGATAPRATLGQRVYATGRRANLTIAETAQAAGVSNRCSSRSVSGDLDETAPRGRRHLAGVVDHAAGPQVPAERHLDDRLALGGKS